MKKDCQ